MTGVPSKKVRVLVVDDSALVRRMLQEILSADRQIEVVGTASDPYAAREKIKRLNPDVLTLDVEMPRMDGVTFLRNLMRLRPMPVVMVSSLTEAGADITFDALDVGAVDFVTKPKIDLAHTLSAYAEELCTKVKVAARANLRPYESRASLKVDAKLCADAVLKRTNVPSKHFRTTDKLIAIGASTGGTEAIKEVVSVLPPDCPAIVIAQHIPAAFSDSFAKRLDGCSAVRVTEARDGEQIVPGHAYLAPGDRHLIVVRDGARFVCKLNNGPAVNRHKPSVDVLFRSVAQNVGGNATGVILTGMGDDGARGLKEMREAGAVTVAQDEKTSVVWGMPGEAVKIDAASHILPLGTIAQAMLEATGVKTLYGAA